MRWTRWALSIVIWCSACRRAPPEVIPLPVPPVVLPVMVTLPDSLTALSFTERIASFLSGKLPEPMPSASPSAPATPSTTRPAPPSGGRPPRVTRDSLPRPP